MTDIKYTPRFKTLIGADFQITNNGHIFEVSRCIMSQFSNHYRAAAELDENMFEIPDRFPLLAVDYILCFTPFQKWTSGDLIMKDCEEILYNGLELFEYLDIRYNSDEILTKLIELLMKHIKSGKKINSEGLTKVIGIYKHSESKIVSKFFTDVIEYAKKTSNLDILTLFPSVILGKYILKRSTAIEYSHTGFGITSTNYIELK